MNRFPSAARLLHRRAWRRRLVLGTYAGYALFAVSCVYTGGGSAGSLLVRLPFFALLTASYLGLYLATRETAARGDETLDEREERVRGRAHAAAYRAMTVLVAVALGYVLLAIDYPRTFLAGRGNDLLSEVLIFLVLLMVSLPTAVVAWTEPDLPGEHGEPDGEWSPLLRTRTLDTGTGTR